MLPGNINDRIVTCANKYKGFEANLFSKTGEYRGENSKLTTEPMIGTKHIWTQIFEQKETKTFTRIARIETNLTDVRATDKRRGAEIAEARKGVEA